MIILQKSPNGPRKMVPTGFSWTTFFFGIFPALLRGDAKNAAFMFFSALLTLGFAALVWPFIYNDIYINDLKAKGWTEVKDGFGVEDSNDGKAKVPVYHEATAPSSGFRDNPRLDILYSEPEQENPKIKEEPKPVPPPVPTNHIGVAASFGRKVA